MLITNKYSSDVLNATRRARLMEGLWELESVDDEIIHQNQLCNILQQYRDEIEQIHNERSTPELQEMRSVLRDLEKAAEGLREREVEFVRGSR